jgi:hypothetical protein
MRCPEFCFKAYSAQSGLYRRSTQSTVNPIRTLHALAGLAARIPPAQAGLGPGVSLEGVPDEEESCWIARAALLMFPTSQSGFSPIHLEANGNALQVLASVSESVSVVFDGKGSLKRFSCYKKETLLSY